MRPPENIKPKRKEIFTRPNCLVKIIFISLKGKTTKKFLGRNVLNEELVVRYDTCNLNTPEAQSRGLLQGGSSVAYTVILSLAYFFRGRRGGSSCKYSFN